MSKRKYPPAVHYYAREPGQLGRIACGRAVRERQEYSDEVGHVSCYACARHGPDLTIEQRIDVWDHANERMQKTLRCPWDLAEQKEECKASAEAKPFGMPLRTPF